MGKISAKISAAFKRIPIAAYIWKSFIIWFLIAAFLVLFFFVILWTTGNYEKLEVMLDLKFNSPIIVAPMWIFVALFVVSFFVGVLMYIHKDKRKSKIQKITLKTDFENALAPAFKEK